MSSASPSSFASPRRHSVPRPLHLPDIAAMSSPSPGPPNLAPSPTPSSISISASPLSMPASPHLLTMTATEPGSNVVATSSVHSPQRRQSSISYFSPQHEHHREREWKRASRSGCGCGPASSGLGRSVSASRGVLEEERPCLTLGEKHSDLLHLIAQKESHCLELRTQLAAQEEELAELKRKWERTINRGVERENTISNANTAALHALASPGLSAAFGGLTSPGLALEGLKGGVQEVGRLFSLSAGVGAAPMLGVASPAGPSGNGNSGRQSGGETKPKAKTRPVSWYGGSSPSSLSSSSTRVQYSNANTNGSANANAKSRHGHAPKDSHSSSSTSRTTTTTSTSRSASTSTTHRLSQGSSATSLDEEDAAPCSTAHNLSSTPSSSLRHVYSSARHLASTPCTTHQSPPSAHGSPQELIITDTGATPTCSPNPAFLEQRERRRRRREEEREKGDDEDPWNIWGTDEASSPGPPPSSHLSSSASLVPPAPSPTPSTSSIVKLGALTSPQSWIDSVGKKLGQLQNSQTVSALSKSQKRASLMISDMSQTIASALGDPGSARPLTRAAPLPSASASLPSMATTNSSSSHLSSSTKPSSSYPSNSPSSAKHSHSTPSTGSGFNIHGLTLLKDGAPNRTMWKAKTSPLIDDDDDDADADADEGGFGPRVAVKASPARPGMAVMMPDPVYASSSMASSVSSLAGSSLSAGGGSGKVALGSESSGVNTNTSTTKLERRRSRLGKGEGAEGEWNW